MGPAGEPRAKSLRNNPGRFGMGFESLAAPGGVGPFGGVPIGPGMRNIWSASGFDSRWARNTEKPLRIAREHRLHFVAELRIEPTAMSGVRRDHYGAGLATFFEK